VVFHLPITANDVGKKDGVALLLNEIIFTYLNFTLPKYIATLFIQKKLNLLNSTHLVINKCQNHIWYEKK